MEDSQIGRDEVLSVLRRAGEMPILDRSIPSSDFPVQSEGTNASLPISPDFDGW
jgi:hypothetical protein